MRRPGSSRRSSALEDRRLAIAVAGADRLEGNGERPVGKLGGARRVRDCRVAVGKLEEALAGSQCLAQLPGALRERLHPFEGGEREQCERRDQHAIEAPGGMGRDCEGEHCRDRRADDQEPQSVTRALGERRMPGASDEPGIGVAKPADPLVHASIDGDLRGAAHRLDELGGELTACGGLERPGPPPSATAAAGTAIPADKQAGCEHDRRGREDRGGDPDGDRAGHKRDEPRAGAPQVEVLERVDVGDEPREQVTLPIVAELRGRERLDGVVHPDARPPQSAQSQVVRREPLEVPGKGPREAEEPHADDGDGEREHSGTLCGSGDQIARRRHEADAAEHRRRAERDGERKALARDLGDARAAGVRSSCRPPLSEDDGLAGLEHDDPVGVPRQLRPVRDEQDGVAVPEPFDGVADELRALRVEVRGRLVEYRRAARREGTRARARCRRRSPADSGRPPSPTTVS